MMRTKTHFTQKIIIISEIHTKRKKEREREIKKEKGEWSERFCQPFAVML